MTLVGARAEPWRAQPRRGVLAVVASFFARVAMLAVLSVVLGVIGGLVVLPLLGPPALAGKVVADQFNALPSVLVEPPLAQHSLLKDRNGATLAVLHGAEDRVLVTRDQIPEVMKRAIVAVEDQPPVDGWVCEHGLCDGTVLAEEEVVEAGTRVWRIRSIVRHRHKRVVVTMGVAGQ